MSNVKHIEDSDRSAQETAGMLNKNWHQIIKAAMLKMGITEVELPYSHLETALEDETHLSIQVNEKGFKLRLITMDEANEMAKDEDTAVMDVDTSFVPPQKLNS